MDYALEERIGNPDLFTGRTKELDFFLRWVNDIKEKKSQSTALLARRKMGKTALMERLFNITFFRKNGVIPFYYEIKENHIWAVDFCKDFFLTFIYQYIAFKTGNLQYITPFKKDNLEKAKEVAVKENLEFLVDLIDSVDYSARNENIGLLWETVRTAPHMVATRQKEFIVQMIDEFQFLNAVVYMDKKCETRAKTLAAGYLSTAESKVAPLLVSGSWVGWLMNQLIMMLPARFNFKYLKNMPETEALEMVFNYSRFFNVPVTEETVYLLAHLSEGSPFYISSIFRSGYEEKDLTTIEGLTGTLEFETLSDQGRIKSTWMEYIDSAFPRINELNAKRIVLYLCKHRDREVTRKELLDELKLDLSDGELEKKLKAMIKADIIKQGASNFRYRGVNDNIFDKVFRGVYQEEIESFEVGGIKKEYFEALEKLRKQYNLLLGKFNYQKGYFAEYLILDQLKFHGGEKNKLLKSITHNLPDDFQFSRYSRVWRYDSSPEYARSFNVDIFARAENPGDYSIIGEVKSRDVKKFSKDELIAFEFKFQQVVKQENIERVAGFIFSRSGFTKEALAYCKKKGIAYSDDVRWIEG